MLSERLRDFLAEWCGLDSNAEETGEMLRGPAGAYYRPWLPTELDQAIRGHEITTELMSDRFGMYFPDQATLDRWLRQRWDMWFVPPAPR
jgi:hypothetical protein